MKIKYKLLEIKHKRMDSPDNVSKHLQVESVEPCCGKMTTNLMASDKYRIRSGYVFEHLGSVEDSGGINMVHPRNVDEKGPKTTITKMDYCPSCGSKVEIQID